ncbi:MAG: type II toxin-antitoxin system HicA family toxin [Bacteroidota bacterium]|jgi:predicted RNA binding protein YcfA (HicA-like mRNA interferase family)|nr:type II toxin-antitoxin system HicA family toxin [Bacteroidota bacterium]
MNLPRDIDASKLIKALRKLGYETTRQSGSHIRLTTQQNGQHHLTIPNHDPLKIGTLNAIITEVAKHLGVSKQELVERLF